MNTVIPLPSQLRVAPGRMVDRSPVYYAVLEMCSTSGTACEATNVIPYAVLEARHASQEVRTHAFSCTARRLRIAFEPDGLDPETFVIDLAKHGCDPNAARGQPNSERRFQWTALEGEFSLLEVVTHIHAAPLLTGTTNTLTDYTPSSYRAYRDLDTVPWLTTSRALDTLDCDVEESRLLLDQCLSAHIAAFSRRAEGRLALVEASLDQPFLRRSTIAGRPVRSYVS